MAGLKKCPNECGTDLEKLSDTEYFCKTCDLSYKLEKGKIKVSSDSKGILQKMQEDIAILQKESGDLHKYLFEDDSESALPFM